MSSEVHNIAVDQIVIPNPRVRQKVVFQTIVASIRDLGLKRPITVTRRLPAADSTEYDLVCGQGRLEAYRALGHTTIPAIIVDATPPERFLMGLVENVARRRPTSMELLREVTSLRQRGYNAEQIAGKLGMDRAYIHQFVNLLQHGDQRLIADVERGRVPISVALKIATGTDAEVQQALCDAYENGGLRGKRLAAARRVITIRLANGKKIDPVRSRKRKLSAEMLMREYQRHIDQQNWCAGRRWQASESF